jgi:predicted ATPase
MRLSKLTIYDFKNLHDFTIEFAEDEFTTVILGQNGTGKSNLLEALIIIFRDLDLGETPKFKYKLEYLWKNHRVHIDADPARSPRVQQVRIVVSQEGQFDTVFSLQQFSQQSDRLYLPSYVFGYYSGPSNRMETHFDKHQDRFYKALLRGVDRPLRPLLYARHVHSQFVLLSFFIEQDEKVLEFLSENLGIEELISVMFVMRQPPWWKKNNKNIGGDPRFWKAKGVVSNLLSKLYGRALAPLRLTFDVNLDFKEKNKLEHLYLYLKDVDVLKDLYKEYDSQQEFFKALESTYISKILSEVRIQVQVRNADGLLTFRDLSEGEQQLLMVLGLLRFTREDEALFLLDEPDTHLNPVWSIQYQEFLQQIVGKQKTSQIIMSTHNPLVISSLERSQVKIMRRDDQTGAVTAEEAEESPRGMGVAAILTSDIFGLRSTLDLPTQAILDERRELAAQDDLSLEQEERMDELNQELEGLDFSITMRDPLYHDFVKEYTRRASLALKQNIVLTPEQQEEQRRLTRIILQELRQKREQEQQG